MILRNPPIPREKSALVMPTLRALPTAAKGTTRELTDGRGELLLDGEPSGIFSNEDAAKAQLAAYKRMGIAK